MTGRLTPFVQKWYMQLLPMLMIPVSCSAFFSNEVDDLSDPFILPQQLPDPLLFEYASSKV